jgi:hypothetical protein
VFQMFTCGLLNHSYFDFQNFHQTTRRRWSHYYTLSLVYMTLDSKSSEKNRLYLDISRSFKCSKCSLVVCLNCYYLRSVRWLFLYCEKTF